MWAEWGVTSGAVAGFEPREQGSGQMPSRAADADSSLKMDAQLARNATTL